MVQAISTAKSSGSFQDLLRKRRRADEGLANRRHRPTLDVRPLHTSIL
jgi:hypothetical protein